jgi:ATP-dependent RNA helicase RhlE
LTSFTFADLPLDAPLQRALAEANHITPTPIQAATIPPLLEGRDLVGCAQTGTGKTAAFALPILQRFLRSPAHLAPYTPRALVLSPTRELAAQIGDSFRLYGKHMKFKHAVAYGGVGYHTQIQSLRKGVQVLVATPGRLLDLVGQGYCRLNRLEVFVLDEADRMLDMGFLPDLRRIVAELPEKRQSLFFSATMPHEIRTLAASFLCDPVSVAVDPVSSAVDAIDQQAMLVSQDDKRAALETLLADDALSRVLVFTRTRRRAESVAKQLRSAGFSADAIHGDKSQNARQYALREFRAGRTRVLAATDVAARGIDVPSITHVINYDLPDEPESYVHRIGRTGRAGAGGVAITFYDRQERRNLREIEKLVGKPLAPDSGDLFGAAARKSNGRGAKRGFRPGGRPKQKFGNSDNRRGDTRSVVAQPVGAGVGGAAVAGASSSGARGANFRRKRKPKAPR